MNLSKFFFTSFAITLLIISSPVHAGKNDDKMHFVTKFLQGRPAQESLQILKEEHEDSGLSAEDAHRKILNNKKVALLQTLQQRDVNNNYTYGYRTR
jgi:hypothetical protein